MNILYILLNILISILLIFFGIFIKSKIYNERLLYEVVNVKPIYNYSITKLNKICILLGSILLVASSYNLLLYFSLKRKM